MERQHDIKLSLMRDSNSLIDVLFKLVSLEEVNDSMTSMTSCLSFFIDSVTKYVIDSCSNLSSLMNEDTKKCHGSIVTLYGDSDDECIQSRGDVVTDRELIERELYGDTSPLGQSILTYIHQSSRQNFCMWGERDG